MAKDKARQILAELEVAYALEKDSANTYGEQSVSAGNAARYRKEAAQKRDESERRAATWSRAVYIAREVINGR